MPSNCISFVNGVDIFGAQPPDEFPHRFAVVTWFSRGQDSAEPWPLVRLAEPRLRKLTGAETIIAEIWERRRQWVFFRKPTKVHEVSLSELLLRTDDDLYGHAEFPAKLRFERKGEVVLWMETERWDLVGGIPDTYHDSVTLSFFSKSDLSKELEELFRTEAAKAAVKIEETA